MIEERIIVPERAPNRLLEQQVSDLLDRAENEPDNVERWKLFQRLRDLAFSLRFPERGRSIWPPLIAVSGLVAIIVVLYAHNTRNTHYYHHPQDYLRVIENLDPCLPDGSCGYRFVLQNVKDGRAFDPTEMHFCSSLQPRFEAGHVLQWIRYTDLGSCLAIDGWDVVHGSDGKAITAPNCKPDYTLAPVAGHIGCEGGKAKFD